MVLFGIHVYGEGKCKKILDVLSDVLRKRAAKITIWFITLAFQEAVGGGAHPAGIPSEE